jgi:prevent-host-death family protein
MGSVTVRELRNDGGHVLDRVMRGEQLVVTRDGEPVAQLSPVARAALDASTLLARWSAVPHVDPEAFRADIDAVIDQSI